MGDIFGWTLMYACSGDDIKKKEDVLTLITHFVLIRNGYQAIGLGDTRELSGKEEGAEILPKGWNDSTSYAIRYLLNGRLYILRGVTVAGNIVFNLLEGNGLNVSTIAFNPERMVKSLNGPVLDCLVEGPEQMLNQIKKELVDPHAQPSSNKEATTQTPTQTTSVGSSQSAPVLPHNIPRPAAPAVIDPFWSDPERDPLRVGRSDLDPFGGGGGMLFNPFGPRNPGIRDPGAGILGGLPRGSVPPGARFDPFGPPMGPNGRRPRPPPDADHFPPPGPDSMFM